MNCDMNLWYVKWFFWSLDIIDQFTGNTGRWKTPRAETFKNGTNLCHFFRSILYGSLIFTHTFCLYGFVVFVVFILPFILFPPSGVFGIIALILLAVTAISAGIGAAVGIVYCGGYGYEKIKVYYQKETKNPGFCTVVITYVVSIKQMFCPTIIFNKE